MERKDFIKTLGSLALGGAVLKMNALNEILTYGENSERMPILFVGHGSPMNAIEDNAYSRGMREITKKIPKPKAILMVSAHWETNGTYVTNLEKPETIHDFGGFPKALFDVQYPAPGSKWLAEETKNTITKTSVGLDHNWGFDHGAWSVTKNMYPAADVPMIQLSLDYTKNAQHHYELGLQLKKLRDKGVLIIGSGNMVHNFSYAKVNGYDFNEPFGHDWALEANSKFKQYISEKNHLPLIDYKNQGKAFNLAVPTPEHYLPLLYILGLQEKNETAEFFNDAAVAGSFTMTSVLIK